MVASTVGARAQLFAVESTYNPGGTYGSAPSGTTYGWSFSVGETPLSVTHLGYFDAGLDGLVDEHRVGIWDFSGALLVEGTVPAGAIGTDAGAYAFTSVDATTLPANETYFIGGMSPSASDAVIAFAGPQTYAPQVTYLGASYSETGGFTAPDTLYGASHGIFGPNFQFTPIPEPHHHATLAGIGLAIFFGVRRRISSHEEHL